MKKFLLSLGIALASLSNVELSAGGYQTATIRNHVEYKSIVVFSFVKSCSSTMLAETFYNDQTFQVITEAVCSCMMDEFRQDFNMDEFKAGGVRLARMMASQYTEACRESILGNEIGFDS